MIESVEPRTGSNPLTMTPIVPATALDPQANPINGHEQNVPQLWDLQYACTFPFATPMPREPRSPSCERCKRQWRHVGRLASNSPLCQPPMGGPPTTTQYYGKAYPSTRELSFVQGLGERGLAASICPKEVVNVNSPNYGYAPAFASLLRRIAKTVQ